MKRLIIATILALSSSAASAGTICNRAMDAYVKRAHQLRSEQEVHNILSLASAAVLPVPGGGMFAVLADHAFYRGEFDMYRLYQPMRTACYGHELHSALEKAGWDPHLLDYDATPLAQLENDLKEIRLDVEQLLQEFDAYLESTSRETTKQ